jgi:hypothetical protein
MLARNGIADTLARVGVGVDRGQRLKQRLLKPFQEK